MSFISKLKNKISDDYIVSLIILLIFFASNYYIIFSKDMVSLSYYVMLMWIIAIRPVFKLLGLKRETLSLEVSKSYLSLWLVFGLSLFLAELYHNDLRDSLFYLSVFPVLFILGINRIYIDRVRLHILNIFASLPFLLIAAILVLSNHTFFSNGIALVILSGILSMISLEHHMLRRKNLKAYVFYLVLILFMGYIVTGIKSRTSIISFLICFVLTLAMDFVYVIKSKDKSYKKFLNLYKYAFLNLIIIALSMGSKLDFFSHKWSGDISSRRFEIWTATLKSISLMGRGFYYYIDNDLVGPHNIFIGLIGFTGLISCLVFIILIFKFIFDFFKRLSFEDIFNKDKDILIYALGYMIAGMFEGFVQAPFYRVSNIMFFSLLSSFYLELDSKYEKNSLSVEKEDRGVYILYLGLVFIVVLASLIYIKGPGNIIEFIYPPKESLLL